ncbi:monovalent cation:proton antiporter-2 (CPA2) family protein [Gayadomonas joobiniege]|uniref:monovalent cation:proton antiporter-2 (CPA2) family protein n=1 Tax=Gayadomonas joobiniege TaxID=1234606 RepID=UPI00037DBEE7|nr:monovalent cation:proton antiporter-2 (CPA2) family protein [Gayadomonas joobiniege]
MLGLALIYLLAAIIAVPVAKRLGLGSVLGYILAGLIIGPSMLSLVGEQTDVMHFAEFGVVMMLFLIGLELHPARLWRLRKSILGLGGLQVILTAAAIFVLSFWSLSLSWQAALALSLMLALSSTAIVIQTLEEKGWIKQEAGQNAFSVLLFQDIAVIPMLALLPLLAVNPDAADAGSHESLISNMAIWAQALIVVGVIGSIILAGRYISAPIFRYIAETRMREIFTLFALFLVIGISFLMQAIGLSAALGTFLAGVVLAESEFRHELEINIEPFKGLLLGLFFITVGAQIDLSLLVKEWAFVLICVVALISIKAVILFGLSLLFKLTSGSRLLFALALAQGGEFAFVLQSATRELDILTESQNQLVTLVVILSMVSAPLLLSLYARLAAHEKTQKRDYDAPEEIQPSKNVIIAGYGRFGQVVGRLLSAQGYEVTVLDHSPSQVDLLRRFGRKVFYGDAGRPDLLEAAGANQAQLLVIAIDDPFKSLAIVDIAKQHFPNLKLAVRAIDRRHAYQLISKNVAVFNRETFDSAINVAVDALKLLGNSEDEAKRAGEIFRAHDIESLYELQQMWGNDQSYGVAVKQRTEDLAQVLAEDKKARSGLKTCQDPENQSQ